MRERASVPEKVQQSKMSNANTRYRAVDGWIWIYIHRLFCVLLLILSIHIHIFCFSLFIGNFRCYKAEVLQKLNCIGHWTLWCKNAFEAPMFVHTHSLCDTTQEHRLQFILYTAHVRIINRTRTDTSTQLTSIVFAKCSMCLCVSVFMHIYSLWFLSASLFSLCRLEYKNVHWHFCCCCCCCYNVALFWCGLCLNVDLRFCFDRVCFSFASTVLWFHGQRFFIFYFNSFALCGCTHHWAYK